MIPQIYNIIIRYSCNLRIVNKQYTQKYREKSDPDNSTKHIVCSNGKYYFHRTLNTLRLDANKYRENYVKDKYMIPIVLLPKQYLHARVYK